MVIPQNYHIGIKGLIVNNKKALVLLDPRFNGFDLPGGKIDEGEDIDQALKRELYEELGLEDFTKGELVHVYERTDYKKKGINLMLICFMVKAKISDIRLSDEHSEFKWISKKDLNDGKFRNEGIKVALAKVLK